MPSSPVFMLPPDDVRGHHLSDPAFRKFLVFSVVVHVFVVILAGSMTLFRLPGTAYSPTYTVDLISLPSPQPQAASIFPVKAAVRSKKPPVVTPKATAPSRVRPERSADLKVTRKKTVGEEDPASVDRRKRIKDLEEKVEQLFKSYSSDKPQDFSSAPDEAQAAASPAGVSPVSGPSVTGKGARPADIRFRAYYDQIWARIKAAWVLPEGVSSANDKLLTVVGIRISPLGVIEAYWVEKKSGNIYFDQSAIRALNKAKKALPPLPDELRDETLEVGVNFRVTE